MNDVLILQCSAHCYLFSGALLKSLLKSLLIPNEPSLPLLFLKETLILYIVFNKICLNVNLPASI